MKGGGGGKKACKVEDEAGVRPGGLAGCTTHRYLGLQSVTLDTLPHSDPETARSRGDLVTRVRAKKPYR